jgi:hypothetical protein
VLKGIIQDAGQNYPPWSIDDIIDYINGLS